jgi:hypothetical protein
MTVGSNVKQTLANLENIQSTLRLYSVQEQSKAAKTVYTESLKITNGMIKDLQNRVMVLEFSEPQYKGK